MCAEKCVLHSVTRKMQYTPGLLLVLVLVHVSWKISVFRANGKKLWLIIAHQAQRQFRDRQRDASPSHSVGVRQPGNETRQSQHRRESRKMVHR